MAEVANPSPDAAQEVQKFLDGIFQYHSPFGDQQSRYQRIRAKAKELAIVILGSTPASSREQGLALDHVRAAVMWANASIACNEVDPGPIPAQAGEPVPSVAESSQPLPAPADEAAAPAEAPLSDAPTSALASDGAHNVDGDGRDAVPQEASAPAA